MDDAERERLVDAMRRDGRVGHADARAAVRALACACAVASMDVLWALQGHLAGRGALSEADAVPFGTGGLAWAVPPGGDLDRAVAVRSGDAVTVALVRCLDMSAPGMAVGAEAFPGPGGVEPGRPSFLAVALAPEGGAEAVVEALASGRHVASPVLSAARSARDPFGVYGHGLGDADAWSPALSALLAAADACDLSRALRAPSRSSRDGSDDPHRVWGLAAAAAGGFRPGAVMDGDVDHLLRCVAASSLADAKPLPADLGWLGEVLPSVPLPDGGEVVPLSLEYPAGPMIILVRRSPQGDATGLDMHRGTLAGVSPAEAAGMPARERRCASLVGSLAVDDDGFGVLVPPSFEGRSRDARGSLAWNLSILPGVTKGNAP